MNRSTHEELLHRVLDGEATLEESARLRELLVADPAIRAQHAELESLFQMLQAAGQIDPPEAWQKEVVRTLQSLPPTARLRPRATSSLVAALRRQITGARALAFVTGAIVGMAVFALFRAGPQFDRSVAPGTMLPGERLVDAKLVDEQTLELPSASAMLRTRSAGDRIAVEIEFAAQENAWFEIRFDETSSLLAVEPNPGARFEVLARGSAVRIELRGRARYRLVLQDSPESTGRLETELGAGESSVQRVIRTHL